MVKDEATYSTQTNQWTINDAKKYGLDKCKSDMTNMTFKDDNEFNRCVVWAQLEGRKGNKDLMGGIMLHWANENLKLRKNFNKKNFNVKGYQLPSMVGVFSQYYALHYPLFNYTDEERAKVDAHLKSLLIDYNFPHIGGASSQSTMRCVVGGSEKRMISTHMNKAIYFNNCGSIRYKMATGGILLGFRLADQELLDASHESMYVNLSQFTSEGIGMTHATKGADTLNYVLEYLRYLSILNETYKSVGYDFMEHTLPHGAKVHEAIGKGYEAVYDVWGVLGKYAKANTQMNKWSIISGMSMEEYKDSYYGQAAYRYEDGNMQFIFFHMDWVDRYNPIIDVPNWKFEEWDNPTNHTTANIGVDVHLMFMANLCKVCRKN